MTDAIAHRDRLLLKVIDSCMAHAAAKCGAQPHCMAGCPGCCVGPFFITPLDAWRLRQGLAKLPSALAAAIRERARQCLATIGERPLEEFPLLPCPALDPTLGTCDLYAHRPITCRTFGPPVLIGGDPLPPCKTCFSAAGDEEIEAARVEIDPDGMESWALDLFDSPHTTIAAALANP